MSLWTWVIPSSTLPSMAFSKSEGWVFTALHLFWIRETWASSCGCLLLCSVFWCFFRAGCFGRDMKIESGSTHWCKPWVNRPGSFWILEMCIDGLSSSSVWYQITAYAGCAIIVFKNLKNLTFALLCRLVPPMPLSKTHSASWGVVRIMLFMCWFCAMMCHIVCSVT